MFTMQICKDGVILYNCNSQWDSLVILSVEGAVVLLSLIHTKFII